MKKYQTNDNISLEDIEQVALEVMDMLGSALYFAGAKEECIDELIELYPKQIDKYFAKLPQDAEYGQKEMIDIIQSLKKDYPKFFHKHA